MQRAAQGVWGCAGVGSPRGSLRQGEAQLRVWLSDVHTQRCGASCIERVLRWGASVFVRAQVSHVQCKYINFFFNTSR